MRKWEHFAIAGPRPEAIKQYKRRERAQLEKLVAGQVASLLSLYGKQDEVELDVASSVEFEEPVTYRYIQLEELTLEDCSEFVVTQLPRAEVDWDTRPGVYSIEHNDDNGNPIFEATVHDPAHIGERLVRFSNGPALQLSLLQEIHELLDQTASYYFPNQPVNNPPLTPEYFPVLASDLQFELVVAPLRFDKLPGQKG